VPPLEAPNRRSEAVDPRHLHARLEKAELGLHVQSKSKDSLAHEDHAPSSGDRHNRCFRQQGWRTTRKTVGWCVSSKSRRTCVNLASKIREKNNENLAKAHRQRHKKLATPQTGLLELNFPAKGKKKKKKKHTNHYNPKELGEDQPPPIISGEQNSIALLAERKTNFHSLKIREGQKTQPGGGSLPPWQNKAL
jgi:hypothetical protein